MKNIKSLSQHLKDAGIDTPKVRSSVAARVSGLRKVEDNWIAHQKIKWFIWGMNWANMFPEEDRRENEH